MFALGLLLSGIFGASLAAVVATGDARWLLLALISGFLVWKS